MTILLESQESSSPVITRAVANALMGMDSTNYSFSLSEKLALRLVGLFPGKVAEWLIPRVNSSKSINPINIDNLKTRDLVQGRINDYCQLERKFPAVTLGIGMGGTTAHLALALGGPFLPQAFVLTLQGGTETGNVNDYFSLGKKLAEKVTNNNSDLMSIQHYDPVHDGWLVKRVNHLRLKLIALPEEYKTFLREKLIPGGDIVYLEGQASWMRFRTGRNNVFQVGGWGDISPDEFIHGSPRLTKFAKQEKLRFSNWFLDGYPLEEGPESEWGSENGLGEALKDFCDQEGFKFLKISYKDPNCFSKLAFNAKKQILEDAGLEPEGIVIETFSQFSTMIDQTTLLPLWLIFNTKDSLRFLNEMTDEFPLDLPVFFSGLSTFSRTPDIVPFPEWMQALKHYSVINSGARESHYPSDAHALLDWEKPIRKWASSNKLIKQNRITGEALTKLASEIQESVAVFGR